MRDYGWAYSLPCKDCIMLCACSKFCDDFIQYQKHLMTTVEKIIKDFGGYQDSMRTLETLKDVLNTIYRMNGFDSSIEEIVYSYNDMYTTYCNIIGRKKR